jgi:hypothetical protein
VRLVLRCSGGGPPGLTPQRDLSHPHGVITFPLMQDLIAKASTLLEALPYIKKFSGATFVIKYGGSFMDSPDPNVRYLVN